MKAKKIQDYEKLMRKARKHNRQLDAIESAVGFAIPRSGTVSQQIKTAMLAIECGIVGSNWDDIAQAQALLEDAFADAEASGN